MKKIFNCIVFSITLATGFIAVQIVKAEDNPYEPKVYVDIEFKSYRDRYNSILEKGIQLQQQREEGERLRKEEEERLRKEEEERKKREEQERIENEKKQRSVQESYKQGTEVDFILTFYTSLPCENGGYTTTAWGEPLTYGVVASNVYSKGTTIYLEGYGQSVVADRGGSNFDNYNRLDVFIPKKEGESESQYYERVNALGVVKTKGYVY